MCSPHFTDVPGGQGTKGLIGLVLPGLQGARMLVALQGRAAPFTGKRGLCSLRLNSHQVRPGCSLSPFYGGQQRSREDKPLPRLPTKEGMVELGFSWGLSLCTTCCQLLGKPSQRLFSAEARGSQGQWEGNPQLTLVFSLPTSECACKNPPSRHSNRWVNSRDLPCAHLLHCFCEVGAGRGGLAVL